MDPIILMYLLILAGLVACAGGAGVYAHLRTRYNRLNPPEKSSIRAIESSSRLCQDCAHFDLAEGQAMIRSIPAFAEVSRHLRPADHARSEERDFDDPLRVPMRADWGEFGLCLARKEGVWGEWPADKRRLTILRDADGSPTPDCWTRRSE